MGKATGIFLILAGVGTAALVLPAVDKDAERQLADVVRIATGGAPQSASSAAATSAPATPPAPKLVIGNATAGVGANAPPAVAQQPLLSTTGSQPILIAPPQVMTRNGTALPARAVDTAARGDLARDIQKELKRVGCYDGEVTGEWTPGTRRAMKTFIDRVNAALPIDEPDHILRTMVQGHPGFACGKSCPSGQAVAGDGRCLPSAIVAAKSPTRLEQPAQDGIPVARASSPPKAAVPRDAADTLSTAAIVAGALVAADVKPANRPAAPKAAWETTIAVAPVGPLPGAEQRMAIGGPASQGSPLAAAVGPRTAQPNSTAIPNSTGSVATSPGLPGAIAALTSGTSSGLATAKSEALGPRQPTGRPQKTAAIAGETAEPEDRRPAAVVAPPAARQQAEQRPRPSRPARQAPPVVFTFPTPNYLGFQAPKFVSGGFSKPERSTFGPRIYEGFVRNLR